MINGLILSFQFFTRIPINIQVDFDSKNLKYAIFFLPLVGALIGSISGLVYYFLAPHNQMIAAFLTLLMTILLTGGLHLDGVSDSFDGFLSNQAKEKTLEIMNDSRIGAFGVLSLILLILLKFIMILNTPNLPVVLILSLTNSRWVSSWIIATKKLAKPKGLGKIFHDAKPKKYVLLSGIIYGVFLLLIDFKYIIPLILNFLFAQWVSQIAYKKIDGLTGDIYGMIIELGEAISLVSFWGVSLWI